MTDPRIAALAEALIRCGAHVTLGHIPHGPPQTDAAAAILAALPYGWDPDGDEDWRRLRRIEEAARSVVESQTTITAGGQMVAMAPDPSALFALRDALEEKP